MKKTYLLIVIVLSCLIAFYVGSSILNDSLKKAYGSKPNKQYYSKDKNLNLYIYLKKKECSTTKASGNYHYIRESMSRFQGFLIRKNCSQDIDSERLELKFIDTEGGEMCYGKMIRIESTQKNITTWEFEGSVSNHYCSQIGKVIEVEMEKGTKAR